MKILLKVFFFIGILNTSYPPKRNTLNFFEELWLELINCKETFEFRLYKTQMYGNYGHIGHALFIDGKLVYLIDYGGRRKHLISVFLNSQSVTYPTNIRKMNNLFLKVINGFSFYFLTQICCVYTVYNVYCILYLFIYNTHLLVSHFSYKYFFHYYCRILRISFNLFFPLF